MGISKELQLAVLVSVAAHGGWLKNGIDWHGYNVADNITSETCFREAYLMMRAGRILCKQNCNGYWFKKN